MSSQNEMFKLTVLYKWTLHNILEKLSIIDVGSLEWGHQELVVKLLVLAWVSVTSPSSYD